MFNSSDIHHNDEIKAGLKNQLFFKNSPLLFSILSVNNISYTIEQAYKRGLFLSMNANELLIKTYDLLKKSDVFYDKTELEWASYVLRLYEKGWLYSAVHNGDIIAVAGAFRIPEWEERYQHELPDQEFGSILYVAFFAADSDNPSVPLKLLKHYLKENTQISEIIFYNK